MDEAVVGEGDVAVVVERDVRRHLREHAVEAGLTFGAVTAAAVRVRAAQDLRGLEIGVAVRTARREPRGVGEGQATEGDVVDRRTSGSCPSEQRLESWGDNLGASQVLAGCRDHVEAMFVLIEIPLTRLVHQFERVGDHRCHLEVLVEQ